MRFWHARWFLFMKASIWRGLMAIGMKFHHLAEPRPPRPNFKIVIPSRLSPRGGTFKLVFYVPSSYFTADDDYRFPVVVNFHGGGFTLGTGTDDARWADSIIQQVDAVFVSVEYRLAPEYPFSVGVEDGTDAVLYLASHAEELRLDAHRMALSGFSAGGNFAFTVPLMLYDLQTDAGKRILLDSSQQKRNKHQGRHHRHHSSSKQSEYNHAYLHPQQSSSSPSVASTSFPSASTLSLSPPVATRTLSATNSIAKLSDLEPTALEIDQKIPDLTLKCIISFYPPTDFRSSRDSKRATNPSPEKNLPPMLTNLFDNSYLPPNPTNHPDSQIDLNDPYLSPAAAEDSLLRSAYPEDIILYTCEYDMLNVEGVAFGARLKSPEIGKTVFGGLVKGVPHAFDKKPNPVSFPASADKCYSEACAELKRVFGANVPEGERRQLDGVETVVRFEDKAGGEVEEGRGRDMAAGERRATTTEEDIQRMLYADGDADGKDHVVNMGGNGDERAESRDLVGELNGGLGVAEGKPQIRVSGDGEEGKSEGKKGKRRSSSAPRNPFKLENMI